MSTGLAGITRKRKKFTIITAKMVVIMKKNLFKKYCLDDI
jgi:hypothetical protein